MEVVGSMLAGDSEAPPAHADTLQVYNLGGPSTLDMRDSVLWSSWDKIIQGANLGNETITCDNCFLPSPQYSESYWPGPAIGGPLDGYYLWYGEATITNSTVMGSVHSSVTKIGNSELFDTGNYGNLGGNTTLSEPPPIPQFPTPTQLDAIWSP